MNTNLIIDIETAASNDAKLYFDNKEYNAPSTYKSYDSIIKYIEKAKAKDIEKAALNSWTGKVICIGFSVVRDTKIITPAQCFYGDNETEILEKFGDLITDLETDTQLRLWGWNSLDFDFPFLYDRYRANDIGIPQIFEQRNSLRDVKMLGRSGKTSSLSKHRLDDQLFANNLDLKTGSGNMVAAWYAENNWDQIASYCKSDVELTTKLFLRSRPYKGINIYQG